MGEIRYKIDVIGALKEAGFNSGHIRKNHLLAEGTMQSLRERKPVTFTNLAKLCRLLDCQPGDLLEYVPDEDERQPDHHQDAAGGASGA